MKITLSLLAFIFFFQYQAFGQNDLLSLIEDDTLVNDEVFGTFKTTRIVSGQSVELVHVNVLNFIIGHRFGRINEGAYHFFGLDQATIRLGFEYGLMDWMSIGLGRSSFQKTYDASIKIRPLVQGASGGMPISAALYSGLAVNTLRWSDPERPFHFASRLSYFHQVLIARKFSPDLSLQLSPTLVHRNMVETTQDKNDVYALGLGGRYRITNRFTLNAEYFYRITNDASNSNNSIAIGFDIDTGGHIFQLHFTNSQGMVENYFIAETQGDFFGGDIYFGFNINRVFNIGRRGSER
jgi:opacity protein-like surface antigen